MRPAARLLLALPALLLLGAAAVLLSRGGPLLAPGGGGPSPPAAAAGAFPRAVALPGGGRVVVAAPPERVLLANASAVDLATELVGPERLAALPAQAHRYSRLAEEPGGYAEVPTFERFDAERVLSFRPDLVVCDPWAAPETVARLRELGVAVLALPEVRSLEDVRTSLDVLGRALGEEDAAAAALAALDARVERLRAGRGARAGLTALAYSNAGAGGWSAAAGTTADAVLRLAGFENAVAHREGHVRTSFEELYALDPDFLVVGELRPDAARGDAARFLAEEPALAELRAVRESRVLQVPPRLFSASSQELVAAAEALAREADRWLVERGPARSARLEGGE